jgi:multisubunit Na+/H+ antiporter MnhC subunit
MKIWLAIVIIVLFALGFLLLRWPRQEIKQIIAHLGAREIIAFALLGIAILLIGWARLV